VQRAGRQGLRRPSAARGGLAPQLMLRGRELFGGEIAETRMRPLAIVLIALGGKVLGFEPGIIDRYALTI